MRIAVLICCILALALSALTGLSYTPGTSLEISVTKVDNGLIIRNVGDVACLVFFNSLEGEQQFELPVGTNITVSDITRLIGVSGAGCPTGWLDLDKAGENWTVIIYSYSQTSLS